MARESQELLALTSFVAHQSRGLPIAPPEDARMRAIRAQGQNIYMTRLAQLDLSCAQCHDDHAGRRLAGSVIPQGHPTGYPIYRLEWQVTCPPEMFPIFGRVCFSRGRTNETQQVQR